MFFLSFSDYVFIFTLIANIVADSAKACMWSPLETECKYKHKKHTMYVTSEKKCQRMKYVACVL